MSLTTRGILESMLEREERAEEIFTHAARSYQEDIDSDPEHPYIPRLQRRKESFERRAALSRYQAGALREAIAKFPEDKP